MAGVLYASVVCSVCPSAPVLCCESVKDVEAFTEPSSANSCPVFHFLVLLTCLCSLSFVLAFIQQCISLSSLFLHPPLPPYTISPVGAAQLVISKKRLIFSEAITKLQCSSGPVYVCMCSLYIFFVRMLTFIKTLYQSQGYLFLWQIFSKKQILPRWCYASLMNVISY